VCYAVTPTVRFASWESAVSGCSLRRRDYSELLFDLASAFRDSGPTLFPQVGGSGYLLNISFGISRCLRWMRAWRGEKVGRGPVLEGESGPRQRPSITPITTW
jgi:hypothetical protein